MVFMNAMADFGTPMLIGEGYNVMPVMIYSEFINEVGDQANFAAAMAALMVLITSRSSCCRSTSSTASPSR